VSPVLVDASTLLFVADLLTGKAKPTLFNVFDLASLVEAVVLHDGVLVVDTVVGAPDRIDAALQATLGRVAPEFWSVRRMRVEDLFAQLSALRAQSESDAVMFEDYFVRLDQIDGETQDYLNWLQDVFVHYWPGGGRERRRDATAPSTISARNATSLVRYAHRRGHKPPPGTVFDEWLVHGEGARFKEFAVGSILRAQVYLAAGECLGMAYKPDSMRWPLVWKVLTGWQDRRFLGDEQLLRMAEQAELAEAENVWQKLGVRLAAPLPLLLKVVLRRAGDVDAVMAEAWALRESKAAERFREASSELTTASEEHDWRTLSRSIDEYSRALGRAVSGSAVADGVFAVVGAAAGVSGAAAKPGLHSSLAAGQASQGLVRRAHEAWRARRFAVITVPIRQVGGAAELQADLTRLFGGALDAKELDLLARARR